MEKGQARMKHRPKFPMWKMIVTASSIVSMTPFLIFDEKYKVSAYEIHPVDPLNPETEVIPIPPDKRSKKVNQTIDIFLDGIRLPDGQTPLSVPSIVSIEEEKETGQQLTANQRAQLTPPWLAQLENHPLVLPNSSGGGTDGDALAVEDSLIGEVFGALSGEMLLGIQYVNEQENSSIKET